MLRRLIVFATCCIAVFSLITISSYANQNTSKIICTQIKADDAAVSASVELLNVTGIGGYFGNVRVISSAKGYTDIFLRSNPGIEPAVILSTTKVDGYILSNINNNVVITAKTSTEGETLTIDPEHTSIVFDGQGKSIAASGAAKAAWTIEVASEFIQGEKVFVLDKEYEFNVTSGFEGESAAEQAASLASLLVGDLADFDITVEGNIITCIQKEAGYGFLSVSMQLEGVVEPPQIIGDNKDDESFLSIEAKIVELKVNSDEIKVDGQAVKDTVGYGKPYIENRKTYIPLRIFCKSIGLEVGWDNKNGNITITDDNGNMVALKIGDTGIYDRAGSKIKDLRSENGIVAPPIKNIGGRTYVQLTAFTYSILGIPRMDISYYNGNLKIFLMTNLTNDDNL